MNISLPFLYFFLSIPILQVIETYSIQKCNTDKAAHPTHTHTLTQTSQLIHKIFFFPQNQYEFMR